MCSVVLSYGINRGFTSYSNDKLVTQALGLLFVDCEAAVFVLKKMVKYRI